MELMGINVYWKKEKSNKEMCTFIMAYSHESACEKILKIKDKVHIVRSQCYDREKKCPIGEPVYY